MEAIRERKRLGKALEIANDLKELGFQTRVRECQDGIPLLWVRGSGT